MSKRKDRMTRTTITLPASLKARMSRAGLNWSEEIREMVSQRLDEEGEADMTAAVILNEKVRKRAREGWSSLDVIKLWRRRSVS